MPANSDYNVLYYSGFDSKFKKILKRHKRTIDTDFDLILQVIKGKLPFINHDPRLLPQAEVISGLGQEIKFPVIKMRMRIKECQENSGRVVFLFDKANRNLFFIDIYSKNQQENHDTAQIKVAHEEYINFISKKI